LTLTALCVIPGSFFELNGQYFYDILIFVLLNFLPYNGYFLSLEFKDFSGKFICSRLFEFFDNNLYCKELNSNLWNMKLFFTYLLICGDQAVAQLVEALRYKPEGRGFDSRRCHWNFSLT